MKHRKGGLLLLEAIGEISEKYIADAKNTRIYTIRRIAVVAAVLVLITSTVLAPVLIKANSQPAQLVTVESDFVLELSLDREGNIIRCEANSTRGRQVMQSADCLGLPLQEAIEKITALLTEKGSLTPQQNTVMISSTGDSLTQTVNTLSAALNKAGVTPAVLATRLSGNEYTTLSEKQHISRAKAKLIFEIASQTDCEMKYLVRLSLGELNLIAQARSLVFSDILSQGETDNSSLIPAQDAADTVIREYGLSVSDITGIFYSLDASEDGLCYTVKINTASSSYLCLIDAYSGNIIKETKSGADAEHKNEDSAATPLPIPTENTAPSESVPAEPDETGGGQATQPEKGGSANTPTAAQNREPSPDPTAQEQPPAPATEARIPPMLIKNAAFSSDSTNGRRIGADKLGRADILSWNSSSQEKLAVVYSKAQMEELIGGYNSLKYAPESLSFSGGDLLSDEFYRDNAAAVLIVYPNYDFFEKTTYNSLSFDSAYLSGNTLALNFEDTHESRVYPYAEFIRLDRADVLDVTAIR